MSEIPTDNPFLQTKRAESRPDAPESADNGKPAVVTLTEATPPENGVSGANLDDIARHCGGGGITMSQIGLRKHLPTSSEALNQWAKDHGTPAMVPMTEFGVTHGREQKPDVMFIPAGFRWDEKEMGLVPIDPPATGIEAAVCADIALRQRRGIAKYGKTVIGNLLSFHQWLTHFYEELLDAAIYAKRIIHEHENQTQNHAGAAGVLPGNPNPMRIPRKPGGGRKPLVCPSCGGVKTIGSSMKDGIPIKRCKVCGHVHKSYPHLAHGKAAAKLEGN
jgi:hypothetical protein